MIGPCAHIQSKRRVQIGWIIVGTKALGTSSALASNNGLVEPEKTGEVVRLGLNRWSADVAPS